MTQRSQTDHDRTDVFRPTCPFCKAPWTDAMLDQLDAITGAPSCSCCAGSSWPIQPDPDPEPPPAAPVGDLCCEACGQAIYRKV
jgi:hypothetical protein